MIYLLHIFGSAGKVENEYLHFDQLADAVESVEGRITDDHDGWEFKDGNLLMVDYNHGGPNVIHSIKRSVVDEEHVKIHKEPIFTPQ